MLLGQLRLKPKNPYSWYYNSNIIVRQPITSRDFGISVVLYAISKDMFGFTTIIYNVRNLLNPLVRSELQFSKRSASLRLLWLQKYVIVDLHLLRAEFMCIGKAL